MYIKHPNLIALFIVFEEDLVLHGFLSFLPEQLTRIKSRIFFKALLRDKGLSRRFLGAGRYVILG